MRHGNLRIVLVGIALCLVLGCATRFSPYTVREEIVRQSGQDPLSVFELNLGRFTTLLLKTALSDGQGDLPFAGLRELQLAVFESPGNDRPSIDVTAIPVRGWDPVVRLHDSSRSAMVLIRPSGDAIGDLVLVGAGPRKVIYARLRGRLSRDLPSALGETLREGGPEEVRRVLTSLADEGS